MRAVGRNHSVDVVKGVLMLLVVLGHVVLGGIDDNLVRFVIYSFHMPAFFFVSGYLLNTSKLGGMPAKAFASKYWHRMLKWWCVAWVVYTAMYCCFRGFTVESMLHNVADPYYHLWFVPSLLMMTIMAWGLFRYLKNDVLAILLLLCLGVFFFYFSQYWDVSQAYNCRLLAFFAFGIVARRCLCGKVLHRMPYICMYVTVCVAIFYAIDSPMAFFRSYVQLPLCILWCAVVVLPAMNSGFFHCGTIEWIGRNSLQVYLWHALPVAAINVFFETRVAVYYSLSFAALFIFLVYAYIKGKRVSAS